MTFQPPSYAIGLADPNSAKQTYPHSLQLSAFSICDSIGGWPSFPLSN